jgi:hypothetical protein
MKMVTKTPPLMEVFQYRRTRLLAMIWFGLMIRY